MASLLSKSISMLNVVGKRKEREKLCSEWLVAALKGTSSSILTLCSF